MDFTNVPSTSKVSKVTGCLLTEDADDDGKGITAIISKMNNITALTESINQQEI